MPTPNHNLRPPPRRAFTLVEVIIAVGLLMVVMLGVTYVFRAVTKSVSAGQSIASSSRDSRAAHSVLYNDLKSALRDDDPFFIIQNQRRAAFLRSTDQARDQDRDPATVDIDGDGLTDKPPEDSARFPALANYRNCRTDVLGFFVRNVHRKQTGSGTQIVSPMGARDAYVWYGHLAQAGQLGGATYYDPGAADPDANPVNYYSSDWVVGRQVMLLSEVVRDQTNVDQWAIDTPSNNQVMLLARGARASRDPQRRSIESSRTDLVRTSCERVLTDLKIYQGTNPYWWQGLIYRFQAVPQPNVPLNGDGAALSAPLFLPHCRNFTVEFAGDFVTQMRDVCGLNGGSTPPDGQITTADLDDPRFGQVTAAEPDGQLDFFTVETGANNPYNGRRERVERVRFYGLPRDADEKFSVPGWVNGRRTNDLGAVVPLRDVIKSGSVVDPSLAGWSGARFERIIPPVQADYAAAGALAPDAKYTCVWGPSDPRPQLVRIVVTLEDPYDRMGVGQTYEYVLQVGR